MSYLAEKRKYQRCDNPVCKALISTEETRWESMELYDISAGGLRFATNHSLHVGMKLYFNLYVYNMLSEFNIKLEGRIVRIERDQGKSIYAVQYENINKYQQVQLDELIKSKITVRNSYEHDFLLKEEECTLLLLPHFRSRPHRLRASNYK